MWFDRLGCDIMSLKKGRVNLRNIVFVFLILQPFLDSYILYSDEVINFFGFSPTTIVRYLLIGIIFIYLFIKNRKRKSSKCFFWYCLLVLLYIIIHHFVCTSVDETLIYETFRYDLKKEIFYIARLVYPFILVYITYILRPTKREFKTVIQLTSITLSTILILLNLFLLAKTSYYSSYITGNIFDWFFTDGISRYNLASKGWFNSANQIGGLSVLLLPLIFYYAVDKRKIKDLIILLLHIIACYSIGTRITCIGISLEVIALFIIICFYKIKNNEKLQNGELIYYMIIILFSLVTFSKAPIVNLSGNNILSLLNIRQIVTDDSNENIILLEPEYDETDACKFLELTSTNESYYKELYLCDKNLEFWEYYLENGYYKYASNRLMEQLITDDNYYKIENIYVNLFGMSRSRYENAGIYLEKDIVVHYYTLGIVGVLLFIFPYFLIVGYVTLKRLKFKKLEFSDVCLISASIMPIAISYFTGHIVDELIITLYVGFCIGYILQKSMNIQEKCFEKKEDKCSKKKILFVVDENKTGGVSVVLKDILNFINKDKYIIDILILHDSGDNLKDLSDEIRIIYGNKFFEVIDYNLKDLVKSKKVFLILKKIYLIFLMKTCLIKYKIIRERKIILDRNYDVEIAFKDGFTAVFTAFGESKKKIHWLHYEYKKYNSNGNYPKLFNKILPTFNQIVAVSDKVKEDFNEIYHLEDKTISIGNIVDVDRIIKKSKEESNIKLYKDKLNIISVGRLHECKGYDRLILAISKLNEDEKSKIIVRIYGDGTEKDLLNNLINQYKLQDIVKLEGNTDNPYKCDLMKEDYIECLHHRKEVVFCYFDIIL